METRQTHASPHSIFPSNLNVRIFGRKVQLVPSPPSPSRKQTTSLFQKSPKAYPHSRGSHLGFRVIKMHDKQQWAKDSKQDGSSGHEIKMQSHLSGTKCASFHTHTHKGFPRMRATHIPMFSWDKQPSVDFPVTTFLCISNSTTKKCEQVKDRSF